MILKHYNYSLVCRDLFYGSLHLSLVNIETESENLNFPMCGGVGIAIQIYTVLLYRVITTAIIGHIVLSRAELMCCY